MITLSFDVESTGLDLYHGARPYFFTLCIDGGGDWEIKNWEWPVNPKTRLPVIPEDDVRHIRQLLDSADVLVAHNGKFDVTACESIGMFEGRDDVPTVRGCEGEFPWEKLEDTLVASHMLHTSRKHDLTSLVTQYLNDDPDDPHDIEHFEDRVQDCVERARRETRKKAFREVYGEWNIAAKGKEGMPSAKGKCWQMDMWLPLAIATECEYPPDHPWYTVLENYATADSEYTLALWYRLKSIIEQRKLWKIYRCRMDVIPIGQRMERNAVTGSITRTRQHRKNFIEWRAIHIEKCTDIAEEYGVRLKLPDSGTTPQLSNFVFKTLGCPVVKKSDKTGEPSLDKDVLEHLVKTAQQGHQLDFLTALQNKRKCDTAISYLTGYERFWIPINNDSRRRTDVEEGQRRAGAKEATQGSTREEKPRADSRTRLPARPASGGEARGGIEGRTEGHERRRTEEMLERFFRMHPNLNPCGTVQLRWSSSQPNCFDAETELLTKRGWVKADEITEQDEVAQYWAGDGQIDFVQPILQKQMFVGNMHYITTERQIDLMLTPNHRCLLKNRKGRKLVVRADNFKSDHKQLHAGIYQGGSRRFSPDEIVWICAVQADGSYTKVDGKDYGVQFAFKKTRKIERLEQTLLSLGAKYTKKTNNGVTSFYVGKGEGVVDFVRDLLPDKRFGAWILDCDRETLDLLAEEVFFWDGESTRNSAYFSSRKENTDWIQALWCLSGYRTNLVTRVPSSSFSGKSFHYLNVVRDKDYSFTTNFRRELVPWNDWVYCVSVPSTFIVVRRNGKVCITGNSQNISKQENYNLRYAFGPEPDREWWSLDYQNLELRIPTFESKEPALMEVFLRPKEAPYFGSYHLVVFDALHPDKFKEFGVKCKDEFESTWYQWVKNGNFCVPMDTEALTREGWKRESQVNIGDEVAAYRDGGLIWTRVLNKIKVHDAPMCQMENQHFKVITTYDHRWIGNKRNWRGQYKNCFFTTAQMNTEHSIFLSAPMCDEPRLPITKWESALIALVYTDGNIERSDYVGVRQQSGGRVKFRASIHQKKTDGKEYIREVLRNWGGRFKEYEREDGSTTWTLNPDLARNIWERAGLTNCSTKFDEDFEQFVIDMGSVNREEFLKAVHIAEGWTDTSGCKLYAQNRGPFADCIKLAIYLCGNYVTESEGTTNYPTENINIKLRACKPVVTGQRMKKRYAGSGDAWCLQTEEGSWVMRQEGRIMLTGNCMIYGGGRRKTDATYKVAGAFDMIRDRFPNIARLSDRVMAEARKYGYVQTIPDKTVDPGRGFPIMASRTDRGDILPTTPLNYHVSGTACWCTAKAMIRTEQRFIEWRLEKVWDNLYRKGVKPAHTKMQVHDELVFDFPKSKYSPKEDLDKEKENKGPIPFEDYKSNLGFVRVLQKEMEKSGDDVGMPLPVGVEYNETDWATVTLKC